MPGRSLRQTEGVPDDFLVARNPEADSSLPYLVRIPLGREGVVLKARETWPRTSKVYCHRADGWPTDAEIVERVPTRVCTSRGAAIDLVLDRGRENRSQFVLARAKGRQVIFWQTPRTAKQARPNVRIPTARPRTADEGPGTAPSEPEIIVDSHERYAWRFSHQQATTRKRSLPVGDYAVELAGQLVAAVERKSLQDLSSSLLNGKLRYALAELSGIRHGALVGRSELACDEALEEKDEGVVGLDLGPVPRLRDDVQRRVRHRLGEVGARLDRHDDVIAAVHAERRVWQ